MGHPARQRFIDELMPQLPGAELVLDRYGDRWETGARALQAFDNGSRWHLVVQDDAILCPDFLAGAVRIAHAAGETRPVALYLGRVRPMIHTMAPAMDRALDGGYPWIEALGPYWGVGLIIPTAHVPELVKWGNDNSGIPNYDRRIARWYQQQNIYCWYTVPSVIDHRRVAENPSLVRGRIGDRHAHAFIDGSPLDIDWNQPPLVIGDLMQSKHTLLATREHPLIAARDLIGYDPAGVRRRIRAGRTVLPGLRVNPEDIVDGGARVREQPPEPEPVRGVEPSPMMRGWSEDDPMAKLQAEARRRGLAVQGTGQRGNVRKQDLIQALKEDEQ